MEQVREWIRFSICLKCNIHNESVIIYLITQITDEHLPSLYHICVISDAISILMSL